MTPVRNLGRVFLIHKIMLFKYAMRSRVKEKMLPTSKCIGIVVKKRDILADCQKQHEILNNIGSPVLEENKKEILLGIMFYQNIKYKILQNLNTLSRFYGSDIVY